MDKLDGVAQALPIGVSGALIVGIPIEDWILIGTGVLLVFNLTMAGHRFYREVLKRGT